MATKALPSPEALRQLLRYEPETGKLFWRPRPVDMFEDGRQTAAHNCAIWNGRFAGREAFTARTAAGYAQGRVRDIGLYAHRVIWAIQTGQWPTKKIDHANGCPDDNRWGNLRQATDAENSWNSAPKAGKDAPKGVRQYRGKWNAKIRAHGVVHHLGTFSTPEAAHNAYAKASADLHGEFSRIS